MCIRCFFIILISDSLPMQLTSVKTLNETNFEDWKEYMITITNIEFSLRGGKTSRSYPLVELQRCMKSSMGSENG